MESDTYYLTNTYLGLFAMIIGITMISWSVHQLNKINEELHIGGH